MNPDRITLEFFMSLSVIIPSHNPETIFLKKIEKKSEEMHNWQFVIVDDASDFKISDFISESKNLKIIRNEKSKGAGFSRNIGLREVVNPYTFFFDDDDFPNWECVAQLMEELSADPSVDLAVSSYEFLRDGIAAPAFVKDQRILDKVLQGKKNRVVGLENNENLLRLTNFPWNKLYRSSFIRRIGLRFSETAVQNDVHAHWQSLLRSKRILVTNYVQCVKIENRNGSRISNTADNRRLQAFTALRETYEEVLESDLPRARSEFWAFYYEISKWMLNVSMPTARSLLMREHASFAGMLPTDMDLEADTGIKRWEMWDMSHIASAISIDKNEMPTSPASIAEREIWATEISRLKGFSNELRVDNEHLREKMRNQAIEFDRLSNEMRLRLEDLNKAQERCRGLVENSEGLNREIARLRRYVDSKPMQRALKVRAIYRKLTGYRRTKSS